MLLSEVCYVVWAAGGLQDHKKDVYILFKTCMLFPSIVHMNVMQKLVQDSWVHH